MKKSILLTTAAAVVAMPLAVSAETINLYGWQNHSYEFVDNNGTDTSRIQGNAGNIGFNASVETGMGDMRVNLQCEQFTYVNQYAGGTGWCNRNSKIGLSTSALGEIMFATWLLPYNEAVAQWVDPFYDAGADSHTSIMGSVGGLTIFYNTGQFEASSSGGSGEFNYGNINYDQGFNRRQENIVQYWSPNLNGFVFRFAVTAGNRDESMIAVDADTMAEVDPQIYSTSLAYENGPIWAAVTYQNHEDWAAAGLTGMTGSDAESWRIAGRYIADLGGGTSVQISAMYEDLEYEFNGAADIAASMGAFGFNNSVGSITRLSGDAMDGLGGTMATPADGGDVKFDRSAWMISGKVKFGGPVDFRFSYMDADDMDISCGNCGSTWTDTAADAFNIGLFYTMPAGTELRVTYSEVSNDANGTYGQGISGTGLTVAGGEVEMVAFGIVHWFD